MHPNVAYLCLRSYCHTCFFNSSIVEWHQFASWMLRKKILLHHHTSFLGITRLESSKPAYSLVKPTKPYGRLIGSIIEINCKMKQLTNDWQQWNIIKVVHSIAFTCSTPPIWNRKTVFSNCFKPSLEIIKPALCKKKYFKVVKCLKTRCGDRNKRTYKYPSSASFGGNTWSVAGPSTCVSIAQPASEV